MRPALTFSAAVAACVLLTLGPALPAASHDYVVSSTPEAGETLTEVPDFFVISTNEPMLDLTGEATGFGMQVTDQNGLYYGDGCVEVSGSSMATAGALGAQGQYTLTYQYVSADGHTLSDTLSFGYEPADGAAVQAGQVAAPVCAGSEPAAGGGEQTVADPAVETATVLGLVAGLLVGLVVPAGIIAIVVRRGRGAGVPTE